MASPPSKSAVPKPEAKEEASSKIPPAGSEDVEVNCFTSVAMGIVYTCAAVCLFVVLGGGTPGAVHDLPTIVYASF